MEKLVCDRCGAEIKPRQKKMLSMHHHYTEAVLCDVSINGSEYAPIVGGHYDLCVDCVRELASWMKPTPADIEAARKKADK